MNEYFHNDVSIYIQYFLQVCPSLNTFFGQKFNVSSLQIVLICIQSSFNASDVMHFNFQKISYADWSSLSQKFKKILKQGLKLMIFVLGISYFFQFFSKPIFTLLHASFWQKKILKPNSCSKKVSNYLPNKFY